MESTVHFIVGQAAMAGGAYLLSKHIPWSAAVGVWLVAEGVIAGLFALLSERASGLEKPWNE